MWTVSIAAADRSPAARRLTFGEAQDADMRLVSVNADAGGSDVEVAFEGRTYRYRVGAPGRHQAMNSMIVLLTAHCFGCGIEEAAATLADFSAPAGRGAQWKLRKGDGDFLLIDEAYNANPASMRAALAVLAAAPRRAGRAAHRGARRHAGAWPAVARAARGACRADRGQWRRSGLRGGADDEGALRRAASIQKRALGPGVG